MAIPEHQLDTWARQGAVTQSAITYATIKRALEAHDVPYRGRSVSVFLQGSYGNDTNIYAESDVDTVIRYDGAFFHDLTDLTDTEQAAFAAIHPDGEYRYDAFKSDVHTALWNAFEAGVTPGNKVFNVAANGSRRSADVVVTFEFRRYFRFRGESDQRYETGVCFFRGDGVQIVNYPRQHSENCTTKHQATGEAFKPLVRILKNFRGWLLEDGRLADGVAPSYFIEGLLYNVPASNFSGCYGDMLCQCVDWLQQQSPEARAQWVCANEQYYLLRDDPVCWGKINCQTFLDALVEGWNTW